MASQTIISLALLKVNWDRNRSSYLDTFVPMLAECLRLQDDDVVSIPGLQKDILANFGLSLPQNVIKSILKKARKLDYVYDKNAVTCRRKDKLDVTVFHETQTQVLHSHDALIASLVSFANSDYHCGWGTADAEDALYGYLARNELVSRKAGQKSPQQGTNAPSGRKRSPSDYVVAAFVRQLEESESPQYGFLETVVQGNMLREATYLADIGQMDRKFQHTVVFLDTSFLMFALGHAGPVRREPCKELLDLLYSAGADLRCFRHTREEIYGILHACEYKLDTGRRATGYGPSIEYFLSEGFTASDIALMKSNLERDLYGLRIEVVDTPAYDEHAYVIDEAGLAAALRERLDYHDDRPLDRDVASLAAIARIRKGRRSPHFEDCRGVFVTTNGALCSASRQFLSESGDDVGRVPLAVTDHVMTSLLWVKQPLKAPDLPRKRLVADCYAALQPSHALLQAYQSEIERLEATGRHTSDEVFMLRYSLEAKEALMHLTLGDVDAFVEGTVPEILKLMKEKIVQDERRQLDDRLAEMGRDNEALRHDARLKDARTLDVDRRSSELSRKTVRSLCLIVLIAYLACVVLTAPFEKSFPKTVVFGALLVLGVAGGASFVYGVTARALLRSLELRVAQALKRFLLARQAWRDAPRD